MSKAIRVLAVSVVAATLTVAAAASLEQGQPQGAANAELEKLAGEFMQAWGKGDAKALGALHAPDAIRIPGDGQVVTGRSAIEQNFTQGLTTMWKGSTLAITPGQMKQLGPTVCVGEGRFQITGGNPPAGVPTGGQYLNTYVRQGGRWLLASSAVIWPPPAK